MRTAGPYPASDPGGGRTIKGASCRFPGGIGVAEGWGCPAEAHTEPCSFPVPAGAVGAGAGRLRAAVTPSCRPAKGHPSKTRVSKSLLIAHRCCVCGPGLILIWDPSCYRSTDGAEPGDHLFPNSPRPLSACFIDRPQSTSQKKYRSLSDKEAEAGKVICLGHRAGQQQAKNSAHISCIPEQLLAASRRLGTEKTAN